MRRSVALKRWSVAGVMSLAVASASASTIRDDRDLQQYVDYGDPIRLVGGVTNGLDGMGTGVVIARQWVLTAAHVVTPVSGFGISFSTDPAPDDDFGDSGLFGVTDVYLHEYYDPNIGPAGGFDIALLKLDAPVTQFVPWGRFRPASANAELGKKGTEVGFGATGNGLTGYDLLTGGFVRLAGDNTIDALGSDVRTINEFVARDVTDPKTGLPVHFTQEQIANQFMLSDFDAPATSGTFPNQFGSADPWDLESCVAPGDSGGPVLIDGLVAGINSWILGPKSPYGDGTDDASYGDITGHLRVSQFNGWIDDVIGVPEPGTASLLLLAGGVALMRRRARR